MPRNTFCYYAYLCWFNAVVRQDLAMARRDGLVARQDLRRGRTPGMHKVGRPKDTTCLFFMWTSFLIFLIILIYSHSRSDWGPMYPRIYRERHLTWTFFMVLPHLTEQKSSLSLPCFNKEYPRCSEAVFQHTYTSTFDPNTSLFHVFLNPSPSKYLPGHQTHHTKNTST